MIKACTRLASLIGVLLSDFLLVVFFQAEDGIRDLVRSRGLGDVYKRQEDGGQGRHETAFSVPGWTHCYRQAQGTFKPPGYCLSLIHI